MMVSPQELINQGRIEEFRQLWPTLSPQIQDNVRVFIRRTLKRVGGSRVSPVGGSGATIQGLRAAATNANAAAAVIGEFDLQETVTFGLTKGDKTFTISPGDPVFKEQIIPTQNELKRFGPAPQDPEARERYFQQIIEARARRDAAEQERIQQQRISQFERRGQVSTQDTMEEVKVETQVMGFTPEPREIPPTFSISPGVYRIENNRVTGSSIIITEGAFNIENPPFRAVLWTRGFSVGANVKNIFNKFNNLRFFPTERDETISINETAGNETRIRIIQTVLDPSKSIELSQEREFFAEAGPLPEEPPFEPPTEPPEPPATTPFKGDMITTTLTLVILGAVIFGSRN